MSEISRLVYEGQGELARGPRIRKINKGDNIE
jgi:hypothetical protein